MMRSCRTCGGGFYPRRDYYFECYACWRRGSAAAGRVYMDGYRDGYAAGKRAAVAPAAPSPASLDQRLLLQVIGLCHPDRHPAERWEQANAVTARLLELREGVNR